MIGASGQPLTDGCVSVDPSLIPYGTELEIDGKTYTAADLGRSDAIGIYFETHQEAEDFGTKTEDVYLTHGTGVFGTCGNQHRLALLVRIGIERATTHARGSRDGRSGKRRRRTQSKKRTTLKSTATS